MQIHPEAFLVLNYGLVAIHRICNTDCVLPDDDQTRNTVMSNVPGLFNKEGSLLWVVIDRQNDRQAAIQPNIDIDTVRTHNN